MTSVAIFAAVAALGVHWGWQPAADGGIEYIIRIDPHSVDSMKDGHDVFSNLPPTLPEIRSYRITVSDQPVPHEGELPPPRSQSVSAAKPPGEATSQPSLASDPPSLPPPGSRLFPPPPAMGSASPASASPVRAARDASANQPAAPQSAASKPPATAGTPSPEKPAASAANAAAAPNPDGEATKKPWPALAGALIGLFASLAANAWLVWTALEFRAKYLAQIARAKPAG